MFKPLSLAESKASNQETKSAKDPWWPLLPVPSEAPKPELTHYKLKDPSRVWSYRDAQGRLLGHVLRFEKPDGSKETRPLVFCQGPEGQRQWRWKSFPAPRPLYGLERLHARMEAPVLLVEGEKAADAAQEIFPEHVAITSPGGSNAAGQADWSPLQGRQVIIWPDADEAGRKYALQVAELCLSAGAAGVQIVDPPGDLPQGWDLADDPPADWDSGRRAVFGRNRKRNQGRD